MIFKKKIQDIKELILSKYSDSSYKQSKLIIRLENEDHTVGNIINESLQSHKKILFSGLSKPDLLVREMVIKMQAVDDNILIYFFETLDFVFQLFDTIHKKLTVLSKK